MKHIPMPYVRATLAGLLLVLTGCQMVLTPMPAATEAPAEEAVATVVPAEETAMDTMSVDEKIANAMSAGPESVTADATISDRPSGSEEEPTELRAGTNEWVCYPDDVATPVNDPMCVDSNWNAIFGTEYDADREAHTALGISYMLQGGAAADNDDPSVMEPAAGAEWQIDPPHIMIASPQPFDTANHSNVHDSGGPWLMFGNTPLEHVMMPVEMVPLESEAGDDKIANALSAGPTAIRDGAAVLDWPTEGSTEFTELRPGTNGWSCLPDDPTTITNDPLCLDAEWVKWFEALFAGEEPEVTTIGLAYMLQGGSVADNDDPSILEPLAGSEWQIDPPHIMILSPYGLDPAHYTTQHTMGGHWVMFGGTPFEHIMLPIVDLAQGE